MLHHCKTSAPFSCGKAAAKVAGEWPWLCCWELDPPALSCRWCSGVCVVVPLEPPASERTVVQVVLPMLWCQQTCGAKRRVCR